jgi:uncharacterized protein YprB with RNaseH-like and TPR domain
MSIDRSLIGKKSTPQTFEVSREAVRHFMEATGDPLLQPETPLRYAPPTFPVSFSMQVPGLELDTSKLQLLHREQEYSYTRPLSIGEQVTCVTQLVDVRERAMRGEHMTFVVLETTGVDNEQQAIFTVHTTLVIRS